MRAGRRRRRNGVTGVAIVEDPAVLVPLTPWLAQREVVTITTAKHGEIPVPAGITPIGMGRICRKLASASSNNGSSPCSGLRIVTGGLSVGVTALRLVNWLTASQPALDCRIPAAVNADAPIVKNSITCCALSGQRAAR